MKILDLPKSTEYGRVVPKNAFDHYIDTRQKKLFTDYILRISWIHKLSTETTNLKSKEIDEIQIFRIELKVKDKIDKILNIIDKSIPYHIVFLVEYDSDAYLSLSAKHLHPTLKDISVIDWTFSSDWYEKEELPYDLNLKESLDAVFKNLCVQLTNRPEFAEMALHDIIDIQERTAQLTKEIERLKSSLSKSKQFNKRVELNLKLKEKEKELEKLQIKL